jgi:hybrid cluster-associated redox disulfide protein
MPAAGDAMAAPRRGTKLMEWRVIAMTKISKGMIIADVLDLDEGTAPIFISNGMHCLGCPSSMGESIEDACMVHGMDPEKLIGELNDYFEKSVV